MTTDGIGVIRHDDCAIGHRRPVHLTMILTTDDWSHRTMPDIRPFRGVRYDMARVGALSDVVAPPYDVIDPALQDRLYQASPYNVIRLELNREEPGDTEAQNRYTRAARFLQGLAARGRPPRGRPRRALRLPPDVRGRGHRRTPARASWRGSGWSRSARGRSTRTSRRSPAPRPTGWPSTTRPGST